MKHRIVKIIYLFLCLFFYGLQATSLDGTSNIVYKNIPQVFHNGEFAKGFVALKKGFTVPSMSGARLNLVMPASYGMDLRTTGSIILENNLRLDSGFTLSSSGTICGNGYSLILNDDLIIPADSTLKITSTLTIEGNGHTLFLDNFAQILTDSHSTLTLRNLIIQNALNTTGRPPIAANGTDSKIALDNVELKFESDFNFNRGSLYFHNDVMYSGQTSFFFSSLQPSFVAPRSTLWFDNNSTFYYLPSNTNKNLFIMQDDSSILNLDNCSFVSSLTGMTLNTGKMFLSNQVSIEGATSIFNPLIPGTSKKYGNSINAMDWSPDGNFLAIAGYNATNGAGGFNNTDEVRIYEMDPSQADFLITVTSMAYGASVNTINWSPNGKYLAFGGNYTPYQIGGFNNNDDIRVCKFDPVAKTLTPFASARFEPGYTNIIVYTLKWSPDGSYLAIGTNKASSSMTSYKNVRIYYFNEKKQTIDYFAGIPFYSVGYPSFSSPRGVDWNPTGEYVVAAGEAEGAQLSIYYFDKFNQNIDNRLITKTGFHSFFYNRYSSVSWNPNGRFIATTRIWYGAGDLTFTIYKFDPVSGLTTVSNPNLNPDLQTMGVKWNSDGEILSFGGRTGSGDQSLVVGKFTYNSITGDALFNGIQRQLYGTGNIQTTCWHPTMDLVSVGGSGATTFGPNPSTNELQCYNCIASSQNLVDSKMVSNPLSGDSRGVQSTSISQDDKYFALGGRIIEYPTRAEVQLYKINNIAGTLNLMDSIQFGVAGTFDPQPVVFATSFAPQNNTLAIGGNGPTPTGGFNNYDQLRLYKVQNDLLTTCTSLSIGSEFFHPTVNATAWHPTGNYLAIGCTGARSGYGGFLNTNNVRVYGFDGQNLTPITSYNFGTSCTALAWSPDGKYLTMGGSGTDTFVLCKFTNYLSLDKIVGKSYGSVTVIDWNMNNQNLLVVGDSTLRICKFTGNDVNQITTYSGPKANGKWSPDGRFIATVTTDSGNLLKFLSFDGTALTEVTSKNTALRCQSVSWNNLEDYLVLGGWAAYASSAYLPQVLAYKIKRTANTLEQITSLDIEKDFDINVLNNANVQINGIINYNNN